MTPISFLVPFTCIFPMPTQNVKKNSDINTLPWFFLQIAKNSSKSARSQKFLPPHESPKPPPTRRIDTFTNTAVPIFEFCKQRLLCIKWRKYGYDGIFNQFETNVSIKRTFYRYTLIETGSEMLSIRNRTSRHQFEKKKLSALHLFCNNALYHNSVAIGGSTAPIWRLWAFGDVYKI